MKQKHKIGFIVAGILALISWLIAIYYWGRLPDVIPTHFGFDGRANAWANKSFFYVFLLPIVQSVILLGFLFLYRKPQYSDIPTTLWLMSLEKKHREHAFKLIRTMLVGISLWVGLLFTYIAYYMNLSAVDETANISPWVIATIVILMIVWLGFWAVKVVHATEQAIKSIKNREEK